MNHQMSPTSKAVIDYVAKHPHCTLNDLIAIFCPEVESGKGSVVERFRARVRYLVSMGHLQRDSSDRVPFVNTYQTGTGVPLVKAIATQPCSMASEVARCSVRVSPQQYDRMHGPAYVPPKDHCPRSGALDYKRLPSRGFAC